VRILLLTWEHPPHVVGGLGRHVGALGRTLAAAGHHVHVVTRNDPADPAPAHEVLEGVHVTRVPGGPPTLRFRDDLVAWVLGFNTRAQATASALHLAEPFDVVHAHDWLVTHAAVGLKEAFDLPLVATIHATERGRHQGWLPGPMNRLIHQIEWWLTWEAGRVVVCSRAMRDEVVDAFRLPRDEVDVVPNGVAVRDFALPAAEVAAFRERLAPPERRIVLFAGRLEYEKGVQTVLDALHGVRRAVGDTEFLVAGVGTYSDELRARVTELGLEDHVRFTGFLDDHQLRLHYAAADVAVAPSIYEPFGLVAIEAMACGTPVVVGDTGGLREIVRGGGGLTFTPQDSAELTDALVAVLTDADLAARLVARGHQRIARRYDWQEVARATVAVHARAVAAQRELRGDDRQLPLRPLLHAEPQLLLDEATG
jgi:glycogen(starch) synthase